MCHPVGRRLGSHFRRGLHVKLLPDYHKDDEYFAPSLFCFNFSNSAKFRGKSWDETLTLSFPLALQDYDTSDLEDFEETIMKGCDFNRDGKISKKELTMILLALAKTEEGDE